MIEHKPQEKSRSIDHAVLGSNDVSPLFIEAEEPPQHHNTVRRKIGMNDQITVMNRNSSVTSMLYDNRVDSYTTSSNQTMVVLATSSTSPPALSIPKTTIATTTSDQSSQCTTSRTNETEYMSVPDVILQLPKEIRNILAGGIAGMVAKSVVAPVDRIKILYQISAIPFHLRDVPKVAFNIIQQEGIIALWKGNMATMIRVFPYSGIQFMTFDFCKSHFLSQKHPHHHHHDDRLPASSHHRIHTPPLDLVIDPSVSASPSEGSVNNRHDRKYGLSPFESLVAGMIAGTVSVICTYPLDLVRAQLAVLKHNKPSSTMTKPQTISNSNTLLQSLSKAPTQITTIPPNHGFVQVLKDNYLRGGIAGLFRGITPTLFGILPYSGIAFTLNEQGKREIQHITGRDVTTMERLQCGAFSGLIAQTVTYPIEVTRRRMQTIGLVKKNDTALSTCLGDNKGTNSSTANTTVKASSHSTAMTPHPPSLYSTITHLYNEQGIRGFLKGVSMNWMKGPIAFAISFTTFDHVQHILESPTERNRQ